MTNAELISKIKVEIERLRDEYADIAIDSRYGTVNANHVVADLEQLLSFLSTLESEKTISPWKKIHTYTEEIHEGDMEKMLLELSVGKGEKRTKIALPDRIVDILESEKPVPNGLEEAANEYANKHYSEWDESWDDYNGHNIEPENDKLQLMDAFIAGAKWQKEQDEKEQADLFTIVALDAAQRAQEQMMKDGLDAIKSGQSNKIEKTIAGVFVKYGMDRQKEQMMEEAVEGKIAERIQGKLYARCQVPETMKAEFGDRVRIIVCKNED